MALQGGSFSTDSLEGSIELTEIADDDPQFAHSQNACPDVLNAEPENPTRSQGSGQADQEAVHSAEQVQLDPRPHALCGLADITLLLVFFPAERLHYPKRRENFLQHSHGGTFQLLQRR